MKVIDLLNKLYNMEEVPKKIKIGCSYLTLNKNKDNYIYEITDEYYGDELIHWYDLDTKVEIIEEDKKIEKIDMFDYFTGYDFDNTSIDLRKHLEVNFQTLNNKINEIIDYLEENK